jgi:hypothetical protein
MSLSANHLAASLNGSARRNDCVAATGMSAERIGYEKSTM